MHANLDLVVRSTHVEQYMSLRTHAFTEFSLSEAKGIITFPSFHTTCAIVFAWAMWRVPFVRWVGLLTNLGMIAVTPLHGSHYFTDVAAGAAIAPIAIAIATVLA